MSPDEQHVQEALARLGSRVIGLVDAAQRLGHVSYAMTAEYMHGIDAAGEVVVAVGCGDSLKGRDALDRWMTEEGFELAVPEFFGDAS